MQFILADWGRLEKSSIGIRVLFMERTNQRFELDYSVADC
jgi:hypothetical protein